MPQSRHHAKFLRRAALMAFKGINNNSGGPFGAVIVKGDNVLATAHNTVLEFSDSTNHAEINAIRQACRSVRSPFLEGTTIYSTTEPCPMCFSAIHWARISRIVFSTTINDVKRLGFNELSISTKTLRKLGRSAVKIIRCRNKVCEDLLQGWSKKSDKRVY